MESKIFACDNLQCPEEAETRDLENAEWIIVQMADGIRHFDTEKCLLEWAKNRSAE